MAALVLSLLLSPAKGAFDQRNAEIAQVAADIVLTGSIKPASIGQAANCLAVGAATSLTNAASALEPHPPADFGPISGENLGSQDPMGMNPPPSQRPPVPLV